MTVAKALSCLIGVDFHLYRVSLHDISALGIRNVDLGLSVFPLGVLILSVSHLDLNGYRDRRDL